MSTQPLIDIDSILASRRELKWLRPLVPLIKSFFKLDLVNKDYEAFQALYRDGELGDQNFFVAALRFWNVNYEITERDLKKIPHTGPLMALANHPFGGIDGLVMGAVLTQHRPDARLMVNKLIEHIEEIRPYVLGVDVFGGEGAAKSNLVALKQSFKWLQSGGCLATFPGGTVSHFSFRSMMVVDPTWSSHVTSLAQRSGASVLPMFFPGRNSLGFQLAGLIHPLLRTLLLAREMERMKGKTVQVRIGKTVSPGKLKNFASAKDATQYLRVKSYILRDRKTEGPTQAVRKFPKVLPKRKVKHQPIVEPVEARQMQIEIEGLSEDSLLLSHGHFDLYVAKADEIPITLREIGRLREVTFRDIGEGTGLSIDIDKFDAYYLHLFIWNRETLEIVGAYRMGLTDKILEQHGKKGLYSTTLFKLKHEFLDELSPGIELGRSFIRSEYQRKQDTLSILWKGIGAFLARNPQYSRLFGPVSITAEYSSISKDLMVQFLKDKKFHPTLSKMVKARTPHRTNRLRALFHESMLESADSLDDVSAMISEIEFDQKGVPVLLKHYLKLNGVMLSFNRDAKFCNVVDGLILVDMEQADPHMLKRYIGEEPCKAMKAYQLQQAASSEGI